MERCGKFRGMDFSGNAGMMMENKRNVVCSLEENNIKRHKSDLSFSSKERKDKVGERISALQQIVSPYGKTDTASVLLDAMHYIEFLHEQVKVEMEQYSLRNRGLCLVPMDSTVGVAQSNGADIWASVKTPPPPALNVTRPNNRGELVREDVRRIWRIHRLRDRSSRSGHGEVQRSTEQSWRGAVGGVRAESGCGTSSGTMLSIPKSSVLVNRHGDDSLFSLWLNRRGKTKVGERISALQQIVPLTARRTLRQFSSRRDALHRMSSRTSQGGAGAIQPEKQRSMSCSNGVYRRVAQSNEAYIWASVIWCLLDKFDTKVETNQRF
ncbi:hypothetical protein Bca4012_038488 [Brassica carinata]